jgi:hypothetical protein
MACTKRRLIGAWPAGFALLPAMVALEHAVSAA